MTVRSNASCFLMALILTLAVGFAVARPAWAQSSNDEAAQIRFRRGRELFQQNNFEGALPEFRAAVALVGSPNTRLYIARCLHNLHRNAEAVIEYQRAAAEAADRAATEPRYGATRDTARTEAAQLEPLLGRLAVQMQNPPTGLEITVGGLALSTALLGVPTPRDPGSIEIVARAPGFLEFRQSVTVQVGQTGEVVLQLAPDPNAVVAPPEASGAPPPVRMITVREGGGARIVGIAALGVGVVGAAGFTVFGLMARSRYDQLTNNCPMFTCSTSMNATIADGERFQLIANISLGTAIAGVVVGTILVAVGGPREVQRPASDSGQSARRDRHPVAPRWLVWGTPFEHGGAAGLAATF